MVNEAKLQDVVSLARTLLQDRASFDHNERTYKLTLSARVKDILKAPPSDDEFLRALRRAFRHPQNNLTNYRAHSAFLKWAEEHLPKARQLIAMLAESSTPPAERVQHFDEAVPEPALPTPGNRLSIVAYLLMGFAPERLPMIRVTAFQTTQRVLDWDEPPPTSASLHDLYSMHLGFAEWFRDQLQAAAVPIRDMLDVQSLIWVLATSDRSEVRAWRGSAAPAPPVSPAVQDDPLPALVEEFKRAVGYPRDSDQKHWAAREEFAQHLTPEAVRALDWQHFRRIFSSSHYSNPGPQPGLNRYISHALGADDQPALEKLRSAVEHLLYGPGPVEQRLDDVLTGTHRVPNFGESVAMKLLAVAFPDRFLSVYPYTGDSGKAALMVSPPLRLAPLPPGSRGQLAIRSNNLLYQRLEEFFPNDPWGMGQFLYWLRDRDTKPAAKSQNLETLAEELLLDKAWLGEVVDLLRAKRQIIFYGPPGTGKTYVARKLIEYLAPDRTRREVVQFHPTYSYEDFVQGYRPETGDDGQLTYRLRSGPFKRLADRAAQSPADHVLLIDEINRGNLPKIMGELLYLLEYRGDEVTLVYGEEDTPFSLPDNLLIVGTMNTADRSIGLIDAALRRRFHFVPLFPDQPPLDGFLHQWLDRHNKELLWVAAVVDQLNARLREKIGSHLQVGHSYFTKPGLTQTDVERIWKYDVLPFLEDQLFGQDLNLAEFSLKNLRAVPPVPSAQSTPSGDASAAQDGSANPDAPGVQHAPAGAAQPS